MVGGEGSGSVIGLIDDEVGDLGQKISMLFDSALVSYPRQHVGGSVGGFLAPTYLSDERVKSLTSPHLHIPRETEIRTWPPLIYSFEGAEFPPGPYIHMRFSRAVSDQTPRLSYSDQGDNSVHGPHLYMRLRRPNSLQTST